MKDVRDGRRLAVLAYEGICNTSGDAIATELIQGWRVLCSTRRISVGCCDGAGIGWRCTLVLDNVAAQGPKFSPLILAIVRKLSPKIMLAGLPPWTRRSRITSAMARGSGSVEPTYLEDAIW